MEVYLKGLGELYISENKDFVNWLYYFRLVIKYRTSQELCQRSAACGALLWFSEGYIYPYTYEVFLVTGANIQKLQ